MTPPYPSARLQHAGFDLVPGQPIVPIAVLRTPADPADSAEHAGHTRLAVMLYAAYAAVGDKIYDATGDRAFTTAAALVGCGHQRLTAAGLTRQATATDHSGAGDGALVVCLWPTKRLDITDLFDAARALLRPGGVLAVVIGSRRTAMDVSALTGTAASAGLTYIQHLIAITGHIDDDTITARDGTAVSDGAVHAPVHRDVHLFTRHGEPHEH